MKRILITLFAIGMTAMSSMSMAAMSNSQIRKETRFLTDKMAYELNLNTEQYNDVYEVNFDYIYNIRYLLDDVARGYEWALNDYYTFLDVRNDDLRWVLSDMQYRRLLGLDYFVRPIYMDGPRWSFRVYLNYPNMNLFYFGKPYHYRSYCGDHYRTHYHNVSYYRGRYNHNHYGSIHSVRDNRVYNSNRRSDFGSVTFRSNTSNRPGSVSTKNRPVPPAFGSNRSNDNNSRNNDNNNRGSDTNNRSRDNNNRSTGRSFHFDSTSKDNNSSRNIDSNNSRSRNIDNNNSRNIDSNSSRSRNSESGKESTVPSRNSRPAAPERSSTSESRSSSSNSSRASRSESNSSPSRSESRSNSGSVSRSSERSSRSSSSESRSSNNSSRSSERSSGSSRR